MELRSNKFWNCASSTSSSSSDSESGEQDIPDPPPQASSIRVTKAHELQIGDKVRFIIDYGLRKVGQTGVVYSRERNGEVKVQMDSSGDVTLWGCARHILELIDKKDNKKNHSCGRCDVKDVFGDVVATLDIVDHEMTIGNAKCVLEAAGFLPASKLDLFLPSATPDGHGAIAQKNKAQLLGTTALLDHIPLSSINGNEALVLFEWLDG